MAVFPVIHNSVPLELPCKSKLPGSQNDSGQCICLNTLRLSYLLYYGYIDRRVCTAFTADRNSYLTVCSARAKNRLRSAKVCQVMTAAENLSCAGSCTSQCGEFCRFSLHFHIHRHIRGGLQLSVIVCQFDVNIAQILTVCLDRSLFSPYPQPGLVSGCLKAVLAPESSVGLVHLCGEGAGLIGGFENGLILLQLLFACRLSIDKELRVLADSIHLHFCLGAFKSVP